MWCLSIHWNGKLNTTFFLQTLLFSHWVVPMLLLSLWHFTNQWHRLNQTISYAVHCSQLCSGHSDKTHLGLGRPLRDQVIRDEDKDWVSVLVYAYMCDCVCECKIKKCTYCQTRLVGPGTLVAVSQPKFRVSLTKSYLEFHLLVEEPTLILLES